MNINRIKWRTFFVALSALYLLFPTLCVQGQNNLPTRSQFCGSSEAMKEFYLAHPEEKIEQENFEILAERFSKTKNDAVSSQPFTTNAALPTYVIPVVFHVYGNTQNGKSVTYTKVVNALDNVNKDFRGLNSDFNLVHSSFLGVRGTLDIEFRLATIDPDGLASNGVVFYAAKNGYGNTNVNSEIAADAWDNYKYMNVYVQADLYNDGGTNNSGVAWFPSTFMSNANTARVVYNGAYLGTNTNAEFASTLTHEFGHWLNLYHTFEGGCIGTNDNVGDTPSCDYHGDNYTCHSTTTSTGPQSCLHLVNAENYMDYSGAFGCYRMFTLGQINRMLAALQLASRKPLWQNSNLTATGTLGINDIENFASSFTISPNPSTGIIKLKLNAKSKDEWIHQEVNIFNVLGQNIFITENDFNLNGEKEIRFSNQNPGIYFIEISNSKTKHKKIEKVIIY